MRPTTGTMLQQNNNNNYPCLNMSGSTRDMLQKCSRTSLPFPGRMELGLGDLPLIRELRAWALCSKNRRKPGGLLGGSQAPIVPPAGRGGSAPCSRPTDVYLSGEWGRMGYGLPLGLDGGQAGIGALVTVATLKTSEGSGKTQTQCLFLRTEKGSYLYSTAKPGSGVSTSAAASVVGGWLRGKTRSRDTPAGRRDSGPTPPAQTGANRVRVRSGRRWRKSCNAAGREKTGVSRELRGSSGEDPAGEIILEERQEEGDKGGLDLKQPPSPQRDNRRACRSPRCCHNDSPKTCAQCARRAQKRENQDENQKAESPRRGRLNGEAKGMRKERQKNEEEEEEGGVCRLESSSSVLAVPNPDLESNHYNPESLGGCDVEEIREAERDEKSSHIKDDSEKREDSDSEEMKVETGNNDVVHGRSADDFSSRHIRDPNHREPGEILCEEKDTNVNGAVDTHDEPEEEKEKDGGFGETPADYCEDVSVSTCPPEPTAPVKGSTCNAEHKTRVWWEKENKKEDDSEGVAGEEGEDVCRFEPQDVNCEENTVNEDGEPQLFFKDVENRSKKEEGGAPSSIPGTFSSEAEVAEKICNYGRIGEEETEEKEERGSQEKGDTLDRFCKEDDDKETEHDTKSSRQEDDDEEEERKNWRLQESAAGGKRREEDEAGDTCGQTSITHVGANEESSTNVTNVPCADPSTSITVLLANPAPSLPPLGSMATGLPCLEAEEEEEVVVEREGAEVTVEDGEGGQEGKRRHGRELEEQGKEETVATEEEKKEEEEEEEEEEEDEFGVFMQAEGEPAWSEGSSMSASVPCGSRGSVALGNNANPGESTHWTPGWTDSSSHQSDDTWTAFPQDSSDDGRDAVGQWWPTSAVEQGRDGLLANQNLASVFAEAFPSLQSSSDLDSVPTLTQILRGGADQDQGLLDSFHDLNKMICQRYKRANGVSRDLLLKTLHLEPPPPHAEVRPAPRTANRRLSPGLPSANQHAQNAAAKRRLSYDYNRNIME
ncbi:eukaryotic translation initiation factor 5B [Notolabrus celidotus]|uniref:eukaryotic translation initiation factor 5B n=1 Tax=Notolabrus celidotus TaxID=1203425 RepID=UPI00148FFEE4|nr:eukaryotic translation initiation factor 5B [Notolabrus celidotus]